MKRRLIEKFTAVLAATLTLTFASAVQAQDTGGDPAPPEERHVQVEGNLLIDASGTTTVNQTFPTTVEGEDVRYIFFAENGCRPTEPNTPTPVPGTCPFPVNSATITLNGAKIYESTEEFNLLHFQVALKASADGDNQLEITAGGPENSGMKYSVVAVRPPKIPMGSRSVLPWAWTDDKTKSFLTVHNAGPNPIHFRVVLFRPDGTTAGKGPIMILPVHATRAVELGKLALDNGFDWHFGAAHIRWASLGFSQLSSVATETHREPNATGDLEVRTLRELAIDDYNPIPIPLEYFKDIYGPPPAP